MALNSDLDVTWTESVVSYAKVIYLLCLRNLREVPS
jgi:hypothetical protein